MQTTEASDSPKSYNPKPSQYSPEPSAPYMSEKEFQQLQNNVYDLNLDLITSELEYLKGQIIKIQNEINQMDTTKCDKQCQEANKIIESNTVDDILKKINDIFNK